MDVNPKPHYQWFFVAPWIQDDWRVSNKLTLNLGFRWDVNGSVTEENDMLNYAFDPTIVNPVSARVGQQVMGGIRFAGVDGAPNRPWKLDKNNYQSRVGMAYQINEKTVLRAGYGKYFLNPTSQGNNAGFSLATDVIASTDGGRNPTYLLSNPWPNGIQTPPGSALGPETFLGRGPNFSNPDFVVPNVHQFSAGIQRELPWRISLEATYAGSRSYDLEAGFGAYNEPSAAFQAQCDVTLGGSRTFCDQTLPNPFLGVAGFEGTTRFTNATLSRFELNRPFPAFAGITRNQNNIGKLIYDSAQFVANKRMGEGRHHQRQLYVCAEVERGRRLRGRGLGTAERYRVFLAPPASHHRVRRVGVALVPRTSAASPGYLLGGWSIAPVLVFQSGQPWDMPGNVDLAPGVSLDQIALPGKKEGQFIYGVKPCIGQRNATTGNYDLLSVSTAYGCTEPYFLIRENFQRRTAMNRYDEFRRPSLLHARRELREDDADHRSRSPAGASRGVQPPQQPAVRRASGTTRHTTSADFGRINRNSTGQSGFQRFIQMGFRLLF